MNNLEVLRCIANYLSPRQLVNLEGLRGIKFVYSSDYDKMGIGEFNYLFGLLQGARVVHLNLYSDYSCVGGGKVYDGRLLRDAVRLCVSGDVVLDFVGKCRNLRYVEVSFNDLVGGLEWLVGCRRVKEVQLNWCNKLVDLVVVERFRELRRLDVWYKEVMEVRCVDLKRCKKLQWLRLWRWNLNGCGSSILDGCRNLRRLYLWSCVNSGLKLGGCVKLRELNIDGCRDVALGMDVDVGGMKKVKYVCLNECVGISDVSFLREFVGLRRLSMDDCVGVGDFSVVGECGELRGLSMDNCVGMRDLDVVGKCRELRMLSLSGCKNVDSGSLSGCGKLVGLYLDGCVNICDVSFLGCLVRLKELNLSGCRS